MHRISLILLIVALSVKGFTQISLSIEELHVSNIKVDFLKNQIVDERVYGPEIGMECRIKCDSSADIILHPKRARLFVEYNYLEKKYSEEVFSLVFQGIDSLILSDYYKFGFGLQIFQGTKLIKDWPADYTNELLHILPTIRVIYEEKDSNLLIHSNEIVRVIITE